MNVAGLQQHFADLARLLEASGAKGVAGDFMAIHHGLAPFSHMTLKDFSDFLARADTFARTGQVPVTASRAKTTSPRAKGGIARVHADPSTLARETKDLYDRASDPAVTDSHIAELMSRLKSLTQAGLVTVAEAIELKGTGSKTKPKIIEAIQRRIEERKGSKVRSELIHRAQNGSGNEETLAMPTAEAATSTQ